MWASSPYRCHSPVVSSPSSHCHPIGSILPAVTLSSSSFPSPSHCRGGCLSILVLFALGFTPSPSSISSCRHGWLISVTWRMKGPGALTLAVPRTTGLSWVPLLRLCHPPMLSHPQFTPRAVARRAGGRCFVVVLWDPWSCCRRPCPMPVPIVVLRGHSLVCCRGCIKTPVVINSKIMR
jgi:hypothetical protein